MGSPLLSNDRVGFVVSKPFTSREKEYAVGDDFDQTDARNIEVLVRARYVIPVVEDLKDRPKYWYKEVRLKSDVLARLFRENVQLRMHHEPDSDDVVNMERLVRPETTPTAEELAQENGTSEENDESTSEAMAEQQEEAAAASESVHTETYDPTYHTVNEVNAYLASHPEERERVLEVEQAGKARKGILES
jgi:hypothetical protein